MSLPPSTEVGIAATIAKGDKPDLDLIFGVAYDAYASGDLVKARTYVEEELAGNPINYAAWNFEGTVLEAMGDYRGALTAYKKAMDSGVNVEEYYRDYVTMLEAHFPAEQAEIKAGLEKSVNDIGQTSWNMVELAHWYNANGDCQRSIDHYNVAVVLAPKDQAIKDELAGVVKQCAK